MTAEEFSSKLDIEMECDKKIRNVDSTDDSISFFEK